MYAGVTILNLHKKNDDLKGLTISLGLGDGISGEIRGKLNLEKIVISPTLYQLDTLLREGSEDEILIAPELYEVIRPIIGATKITIEKKRGLFTPIEFYLISKEESIKIAETIYPHKPDLPLILPGMILRKKYKTVKYLGSGILGKTYVAETGEFAETRVVKIIRKNIIALGKIKFDEIVKSIKEAIDASSKTIIRPHAVEIIENVYPMIVYDYIAYPTLASLIKREEYVSSQSAIKIAISILKALEPLHSQGIAHGGLHPNNLYIPSFSETLIADIGFKKLYTIAATNKIAVQQLDTTHAIYLAPELAKDNNADTRSDIFSIGVLLYILTTGVIPFSESTELEETTISPPRNIVTEIDSKLEDIIVRALQFESEQRFKDATEMLEEIYKIST